jgi:hypothetical protein
MSRKRLFDDKKKWCNRCKKWLILGAFGVNRRTASGKQDYCKTCHGAFFKIPWWKRVKAIDAMLLEKFHMMPGEYLEQWRHQDYQCATCRAALILYQRDTHVHVMGGVKLLVCSECDKGLTALQDDPVILQRAIALLVSAVPVSTVTENT